MEQSSQYQQSAQQLLAARERWHASELTGAPAENQQALADALRTAEQDHASYLQDQAFDKLLRKSERPTSFFFRPIDEVVRPDGTVATKQIEVHQAHQRFWGRTFGDKRFVDPSDMHIDQSAQDRLLSTVARKLSCADREQLDAPLTAMEIERTIRQLPRGRAPGADGLTAELYQLDPSRFSRVLLHVFQYQASRGILLPDQRKSVVSLLHKSGPRNQPGNFRPISLLPVDTKILSRVLTNRLKSVIATLVHDDQRGFVRGRTIAQSLLTEYEAEKQPSVDDPEGKLDYSDKLSGEWPTADQFYDRVVSTLAPLPLEIPSHVSIHNLYKQTQPHPQSCRQTVVLLMFCRCL